MSTSIGKSSKSFFVKLLVGIIILPFVFWGMGDVFRGGNQNVIASVDSEKIGSQEFLNHLNRLNLNDEQIKGLPKTDLLNNILSEYIGRKVMSLEIEKLGVQVNDNSLRAIIKNDELFSKNKKFSRIEYEKFLLQSGLSAPRFEKNIIEQESKRQYLSSIAGGIIIPNSLIEATFKKENQIKTIKYIDLENYHLNKKISETKLKELFERNKNLFVEEFKSIDYAEISPLKLIGKNEIDESFFKKIDAMENKVLDGQEFKETINENNLIPISIKNINTNKLDKNKKKVEVIPDELFKKFYAIKNENSPEIIKIKNKFYLAQVSSVEKISKKISDPDVSKSLKAQLNFQNKIESNSSILKDISMGAFDKDKINLFAEKNNLIVKNDVISDLKQNKIFTEGIIKRIFLLKNGETSLITNSTLSKNYLIYAADTKYKNLSKNTNEFEKYEAKARLELINKIYKIFDDQLNRKYEVELNQRAIDRIKNSF